MCIRRQRLSVRGTISISIPSVFRDEVIRRRGEQDSRVIRAADRQEFGGVRVRSRGTAERQFDVEGGDAEARVAEGEDGSEPGVGAVTAQPSRLRARGGSSVGHWAELRRRPKSQMGGVVCVDRVVAASGVDVGAVGIENEGGEAVVTTTERVMRGRKVSCRERRWRESSIAATAGGVGGAEVPELNVRGGGGSGKEKVGAGWGKEGERGNGDFTASLVLVTVLLGGGYRGCSYR